jgi:prophage DNA circulation protein
MSVDMNRSLEEENVLVDFSQQPGFQHVSTTTEIMAEKSTEALNKAMDAIRAMARRVTTTIESMPLKPSKVEVSFGIVLNAEAGALIGKVGTETAINVMLLFEKEA